MGMSQGRPAGARFRRADDVSDSDEQAMDVESSSGSVDLDPAKGAGNPSHAIWTATTEDDGREPPRKKRGRDHDPAHDAIRNSQPRWSNPDPYTALPPVDELRRKQKDVVKLIRKSRVVTSATSASVGAAATVAAEDFISLDFVDGAAKEDDDNNNDDDDDDDDGDHDAYESDVSATTRHLRHQAPSGPRGWDRADRGLGDAPGSARPVLVARALGPPPASVLNRPVSLDRDDGGLGSRKRTSDDEIRSYQSPPESMEMIRRPPREILPEWYRSAEETMVPWADVDHSRTAHMGFL